MLTCSGDSEAMSDKALWDEFVKAEQRILVLTDALRDARETLATNVGPHSDNTYAIEKIDRVLGVAVQESESHERTIPHARPRPAPVQ